MGSIKNLTGLVFGRLTVLKRQENHNKKDFHAYWECICDCGELTLVSGNRLRNGDTTSCGCYAREVASLLNKKYNVYDMDSEKYGIGFTSNTNQMFYFDKEDYEKIKEYCWFMNKEGYILSRCPIKKKIISIHRLLFDFPEGILDHINRNKEDNRKENLRFATYSDNCRNVSLRSDNKTGIIGVTKREYKSSTYFSASIVVDKKKIHIIQSKNFYKVVKGRLRAEKEYYGEFAPQIHLFEEYGID